MTAALYTVDRWGQCREAVSRAEHLAALEAARAIRIHEMLGQPDPSIQRRTPTLAAMARRETREVRANG